MRQCSASATSSPGSEALRDGERLVDHPQALVDVVDVEQRGVAAHQRGGERARVAAATRHRHRLRAEPRRARALLTERQVLGEPGQQPRPQRAIGRAEGRERLLEPVNVGAVARRRHVEAPAGAEHRAGQRLRRVVAAGELRRLVEGRARPRLARLPAHVPERDQQIRAGERVAGPREPQGGQRLLEMPRRLLVGVRGHGLARRLGAVRDRRLGPADLAGGEEVVGELPGRRAGGLERLAGAEVQPRAAGGGGGVVERLAHERVPEREAVDLLRVLEHDRRAQGLLQRPEQLLLRPPGHRRQRREAEVAAEHGGGGQRLDRRGREPREPARDEVLDALGEAGRLVGRLGQAAQHLLDEERVAGGAALQRAGQLGIADEHRGVGLVQARQRDALHDLLAREVGEQPGRRAAGVGLGVAQRDEHQQRRAVQAADHVAQQQQRRPPRPLQVLDDEHQRARGGRLAEQRRDRLEQPVAAVLALRRRPRGQRLSAGQLRHQRRQRLEVGRGADPARVRRVVAQRLDERLEGHDGLLVDPAVQHGRAAGVRRGGEARRQPRLADPGLAGHDDDAARAGRGSAPALAQHRELGLAAHERPLLQALEHDRQRDGRARRGAGAAAGATGTGSPGVSRRSLRAVICGAGVAPSSSRSSTRRRS